MSVKKILFASMVMFAVIFSVWYIYTKKAPIPVTNSSSFNTSISIGNTTLLVALADSDVERVLGLSNSNPLLPMQGMLFMFEHPGIFSFWMKDMQYPIDIIWISEEKKVIHIEKNISPTTFPSTFSSQQNALYVLEVASGFSDTHNIEIGSIFRFN